MANRYFPAAFVLLFVASLSYFTGTVASPAQNTTGDCSPSIDRTGGNVTVKCGKADIEVEFLLATSKEECENFQAQLVTWGKDIAEWKAIRIAYFPRFSAAIISDIRENKAVIYEYDKAVFPKVYRVTVDIPTLYESAYKYRYEVEKFGQYFTAPEQQYLDSVETFCRWAGVDLNISDWMKNNQSN